MSHISLKQSKRIITATAGAFVLFGLVAGFKSSNQLGKNLAVFVAAASAFVAIGNEVATSFHEETANLQAQKIISARDKKISSLQLQLDNASGTLTTKVQAESDLKKALAKKESTLEKITDERNTLVAKLVDLQKLRTADGQRFDEAVSGFIGKIKESLSAHVNDNLNRLLHTVNNRIKFIKKKQKSNESEHILSVLTDLIEEITDKKEEHIQWVNELAYNSDTDINTTLIDALDLITQIHEEIQSTRSKYRNTLVINDRLKLRESVHKEQALQALQKLKATADEELEAINQKTTEYEEVTRNNDAFVQNLIKDFEALRLRLAEKDEIIKELRSPITWKFSLNQATKTGNIIITWCKDRGIHLDRSHYTGDRYEADLYFFTDRINAAQTIDLKTLNEEGENLAQIAHCLKPIKFTYEYDTRLVVAHIVMLEREKQVKTVDDFLQPPSKLIEFVKSSYHIGLWGATGSGKSTAISNIIGGMIVDLGGKPILKTTIPKIDDDIRALFPVADWLDIPDSIFGLLEAALEIQFRIYCNKQAYLAEQPFPEFKPIVFFIDEINAIFGRWKKINDADLENVLTRFENTLSGERLDYFNQYMRTELENYKGEFAKRLLIFTWQTGRSLKVKSLIAGQNLRPGAFGLMTNDLENCAYISFLNSIKKCAEYKVEDYQKDEIERQRTMVVKALENREELKYTGMYCPIHGKAYLGLMPPPNYYKWDKNDVLKTKTLPNVLPNTTGENPNFLPNVTETGNFYPVDTESNDSNSSGFHTEFEVTQNDLKNGGNDPTLTQSNHSVYPKSSKPRQSNAFTQKRVKVLTEDEIESINKNSHRPISEIIFEIWGIKPNRHAKYQQFKAAVESYLRDSKLD